MVYPSPPSVPLCHEEELETLDKWKDFETDGVFWFLVLIIRDLLPSNSNHGIFGLRQ